jgi:hypothetical protein
MAWSLAGLACLMGLLAGPCAMFTRHALEDGALDQPAWTCRRAQYDPQDQHLIDRSLTVQIQMWGNGDHAVAMLSWHVRAIAALVGLRLIYRPDARRAMALPTLGRTPVCKRPGAR